MFKLKYKCWRCSKEYDDADIVMLVPPLKSGMYCTECASKLLSEEERKNLIISS